MSKEIMYKLGIIESDVKWLKDEIKKDDCCKKKGLFKSLADKISTNRKLIFFLLAAIFLTYIPFAIKYLGG